MTLSMHTAFKLPFLNFQREKRRKKEMEVTSPERNNEEQGSGQSLQRKSDK